MLGVLNKLLGKQCFSYIDDILIFDRNELECMARLRQVISRLRQANLKLKPSKCKFFKREVTFLGQELFAVKVRFDREKVQVVLKWPVQKPVRQMQSFLILENYFVQNIKDYAEVAAPLSEKTRAGSGSTRITLDAVKLKHFKRHKNELAKLPLLLHPWLD